MGPEFAFLRWKYPGELAAQPAIDLAIYRAIQQELILRHNAELERQSRG